MPEAIPALGAIGGSDAPMLHAEQIQEPPITPPSGIPADELSDALALPAQAIALENLTALLEAQHTEFLALQAQVEEGEEQSKRLTAAVYALPCPKQKPDPYSRDQAAVISIQGCIESEECDCDSGLALGASYSYSEEEPTPPEEQPI